MFRNHVKVMLNTVLFGLLVGFMTAIWAAQSSFSARTDDFTVHVGIMSADRLVEHPELLPQGHPVVSGDHMYHVLVVLFDKATGERIVDAEVEATVSSLGLDGPTKVMHPWAPYGQMNYCNFFRLSSDHYVIQVRIHRTGEQAVRTAKFTLDPLPR